MTRTEIMAVACPRCGSRAGDRCIRQGEWVYAFCPPRKMMAELRAWAGADRPAFDPAIRERWRRLRY